MVDEKRLKEAFSKIKQDMFVLSKQIDELKNKKVDEKTTIPKDHIDQKKFDNFVNNVEAELSSINLHIKEFDDKINHLTKQYEKLSSNYEGMEQRLKESKTKSSENKLDINLIDERFNEFSELLNEKISLETSSMRLEFTEEIAKLYDRFFNELLELRTDVSKKNKKEKEREDKKKEKTKIIKSPDKKESENKSEKEEELYPASDKKDGKLKKIAKWLFVDEEEDEFSNIKGEIKEDSEKRKKNKDDELY